MSLAAAYPHDSIRAVEWRDDRLRLLDQRLLPAEERHVECACWEEVASAIAGLVVRGAPAIGIAAAWGLVLAARAGSDLAAAAKALRAARPTAVNLAWALARMERAAAAGVDLAAEAESIQAEDLAANRHMGELGAGLIEAGSGVLTHCNTGSLATAGFGTALGVIRAGVAMRRIARVHACETRPWLQGARLTLWELARDGIPATLVADSAAAWLMHSAAVQWVVVGADRIAANGDVANKIGTLQLAIAARHYGVRLMVVAPSSSVDMGLADGEGVAIELRAEDELLSFGGQRVAVEGARAWNPVFDVTPAELVDVLVTERGVVERPDARRMAAAFAAAA